MLALLMFIDEWVVDKFERYAHFMEITFGIPTRAWARCCLALAFAFLMTRSRMGGTPGHSIMALDLFFKITLSISFLGRLWTSINRPTSSADVGVMNPHRRPNPLRVFSIALIALFIYPDCKILDLWFEFSNLGLWFEACNDLPPGTQSRVRQFINAMSAGLAKLTPVKS